MIRFKTYFCTLSIIYFVLNTEVMVAQEYGAKISFEPVYTGLLKGSVEVLNDNLRITENRTSRFQGSFSFYRKNLHAWKYGFGINFLSHSSTVFVDYEVPIGLDEWELKQLVVPISLLQYGYSISVGKSFNKVSMDLKIQVNNNYATEPNGFERKVNGDFSISTVNKELLYRESVREIIAADSQKTLAFFVSDLSIGYELFKGLELGSVLRYRVHPPHIATVKIFQEESNEVIFFQKDNLVNYYSAKADRLTLGIYLSYNLKLYSH